MSIADRVVAQARQARAAGRKLGTMGRTAKDGALTRLAQLLRAEADNPESPVLTANAKDMAQARERGQTAAFLDRLRLDPARLRDMAESCDAVAMLPDPVGEVTRAWRRPNGLEIAIRRVPLGVVGIIYEARPNVTIEVASLCLKSGNACVLKGGSDGLESNRVLVRLLQEAGREHGLPPGFAEFIDSADRAAVTAMLKQEDFIDVIVPRGGESLIRAVVEESRIPVIRQYKGVCHTFVDETADLEMARKVAVNAKVSKPSACNAMETLLVHEKVAEAYLPALAKDLAAKCVELRGCDRTRALLPAAKPASDADWDTEHLDLILGVKIVDDLDAALAHIAAHGTLHSEAILTNDVAHARRFHEEVDAAAVYVNASTRFTDGFQFGFGAEVGISTGKLHSRGPMGLEDLTTRKYVIWGEGQTRD